MKTALLVRWLDKKYGRPGSDSSAEQLQNSDLARLISRNFTYAPVFQDSICVYRVQMQLKFDLKKLLLTYSNIYKSHSSPWPHGRR